MNTKYFFWLSFTLLLFSFRPDNREELVFSRINYILTLKENLGEEVWPQFNNSDFNLPLIYFTSSTSYIANPTTKFLENHLSSLVHENRLAKIYKTERRIDNLPFHMETGIELSDKKAFNYNYPFMMCSGVEEAQRGIKELESTEEWASFVLHEYFHGFQFMHKSFFEFYSSNVFPLNKDSLQNIYETNVLNQKWINKENNLLLKFLQDNVAYNDITYLIEFLKERKKRRVELSKKIDSKFITAEKFFETLEGTARYVEYNLLTSFQNTPPDVFLQRLDPLYKANENYQKFNLNNQQWLFKTEKSGAYFYASGFNICRVLDKMKVVYKDQLFHSGALSLEDILENELKNF